MSLDMAVVSVLNRSGQQSKKSIKLHSDNAITGIQLSLHCGIYLINLIYCSSIVRNVPTRTHCSTRKQVLLSLK